MQPERRSVFEGRTLNDRDLRGLSNSAAVAQTGSTSSAHSAIELPYVPHALGQGHIAAVRTSENSGVRTVAVMGSVSRCISMPMMAGQASIVRRAAPHRSDPEGGDVLMVNGYFSNCRRHLREL